MDNKQSSKIDYSTLYYSLDVTKIGYFLILSGDAKEYIIKKIFNYFKNVYGSNILPETFYEYIDTGTTALQGYSRLDCLILRMLKKNKDFESFVESSPSLVIAFFNTICSANSSIGSDIELLYKMLCRWVETNKTHIPANSDNSIIECIGSIDIMYEDTPEYIIPELNKFLKKYPLIIDTLFAKEIITNTFTVDSIKIKYQPIVKSLKNSHNLSNSQARKRCKNVHIDFLEAVIASGLFSFGHIELNILNNFICSARISNIKKPRSEKKYIKYSKDDILNMVDKAITGLKNVSKGKGNILYTASIYGLKNHNRGLVFFDSGAIYNHQTQESTMIWDYI